LTRRTLWLSYDAAVEIEGPVLTKPVGPLNQLLREGLTVDPDAVAIESAYRRLTWAELEEESARLAAGYLSIGLSPGDRLASLMPNRVARAVHYLACFKPGLVATPLNYRYTSRQIDHALAVSTAAALVTHVERAADVADSELAGSLPCGTVVFHDAPSWRSSPRRRESRQWDHGDGRRRDHFYQRFGIHVPSSTETGSALHGASSGPFRFETSSASRSLSRIAIRKRF
jgi:acyl-CoA synthetase (AMP-forming)/AMP-acid ligase II